MRIAVVVPPLRDFYLSPRRMSALGARTVLELCRRAGHEAAIFNFPTKAKGRALPLPSEAAHLDSLIVPGEFGPLSFFSRYKHYGPSFEDCAAEIAAFGPDLVLISSFAYAYAEEAVLLARELRPVLPGAVIAAGGAGPSAGPDYYLEAPADPAAPNSPGGGRGASGPGPVFDFVVSGEAERALEQLFAAAGTGRYLRAPGFTRGEDLSCVFSVLKAAKGELRASVSLSRGCPGGCRFCSNRLCHGTEFRTVPISRIEAALDALPTGPRLHLNFEDDNLLFLPEYFLEVLRLVRRRHPEAVFTAENGLDYRLLRPRTAETLIGFGFESFNLSLGSIRPEAALREGRALDVDGYVELVRYLGGRNVPSITYFIAGLEGDTPESTVEHLRFLSTLPTLVGISLFYPVPGLPGFDPPPETLHRYPGLARGSFAYPWTGALTTAELVTAFRLARYVNLAKKSGPAADEAALLERTRSTGRLHSLIKKDRSAHIVPVPADRNMESLLLSSGF
jgi:radical SAM superfamily enzyme YgiQ (UPF0313 family)